MNAFEKDQEIRNPRTGEVGKFIAAWINFAGQVVVNVRVGRMVMSWNTLSIGLVVSHA